MACHLLDVIVSLIPVTVPEPLSLQCTQVRGACCEACLMYEEERWGSLCAYECPKETGSD